MNGPALFGPAPERLVLFIALALPVFIDTAIKGSVLLAVCAMIARRLRDRSASLRHATWTAGILGHLLLPLITWYAPPIFWQVLPTPPWLAASAALSASTDVLRLTGWAQALVALALIWAIGAFIGLARCARSQWLTIRLMRSADTLFDDSMQEAVHSFSRRLGVRRRVTLLSHAAVAVPMTSGVVSPTIVLPADAGTWSPAQLEASIAHELGHVSRLDTLTQCAAQITLALFWFDPLLWFAARRMRVERERACDDAVLDLGIVPWKYADALVGIARRLRQFRVRARDEAFAAMAGSCPLEIESRVRAILDPTTNRTPPNRRTWLVVMGLLVLLELPLGALRPFRGAEGAAGQAVWLSPPISSALSASNGWIATVPFAEDGNPFFIVLRGRVHGVDAWWLVNTGTVGCLASKKLVRRLKVPRLASLAVEFAGGVTVACDSVATEEMTAWTADFGRPIDGVVGSDLFAHRIVQIDYAAHALRLYDPAVYRYAGRGDTVPLRFEGALPRVTVHVTDGTKRAVARSPFLVTASGDGMNDSLVLASRTLPRYEVETSNDGTAGRALEGTLELVQVGRFSLESVPSTGDGAGLLGGAVLRQFTCILDYPHHRMFLEANEHFGEVFDRGPRSGLTFLAPSAQHEPTIAAVIPGSPAAIAGLRAGDVIHDLDGHPGRTLGTDRVERLVNREGNAYALVIRRGDALLRIRLRV